MSHTSSMFHDVAGVSVAPPVITPDYRWQVVTIHMSDGGTHSITVFLTEGAAPFPERSHTLDTFGPYGSLHVVPVAGETR